MGRIIESTINRFDGGITNDPRDPRGDTAIWIANYDAITNPKKMSPYHSSESGDSSGSTNKMKNFCIAYDGTAHRLFSLGESSSNVKVWKKALTSNSSNDLSDAGWSALTNGVGNQTITENQSILFVPYRIISTGKTHIYGAHGSRYIYDIFADDSSAIDNQSRDLTSFTNVAQGVVHSKDNILYIPYDNKIAKNNQTAWTDAALTLPSHLVITSIAEVGNFLAIGAAPLSGVEDSIIYLWDRDSSLSTVSESIIVPGFLRAIEFLDGELIAVTQLGGSTTTVGPAPTGATTFLDRVIFWRIVGSQAIEIFRITGGATTTQIPLYKRRVGNRLYFLMLIELGGATRDGLWSIGRNKSGEFVLVNERTSNNNTTSGTSDTVNGFFVVGDYTFVAYQQSSTWALAKTDNATDGYSGGDAVYESRRIATEDASLKKDLLGISVTHEKLPSGASVEVDYRTDSGTTWTEILSSATTNSFSASAMISQSSPAALPKSYKEIQFRIRSLGGQGNVGAEVTSLSFQEEVIGGRVYDSL